MIHSYVQWLRNPITNPHLVTCDVVTSYHVVSLYLSLSLSLSLVHPRDNLQDKSHLNLPIEDL